MLKATATPDSNFFTFDGARISIRVHAGEEVKINRGGRITTLATGRTGETLNVKGEVKTGDVFTVGIKTVSFYEVAKISPLEFLKKFVPDRKIVVKNEVGFEENSKSKKTTFSVGIILLAILVVSVGFGVRQKSVKEREEETARSEQEKTDRETAGFFETFPELFLDLTLLSSGFKGDIVSTSGGNLYVLDKNSKKIVSIEIANKKSGVVAGQGKLGEAFDLASYENRVFVLDAEGVKEVDEDIKTAVEKDWEGEVLIQTFAGNLYVLDKSAGAIYRFAGSDDTFGSRQNWLAASTKPDFTDAKSWTFDGAIYVLTGSKILKFSQGSPQTFSLAGEVLSVGAVYADEENQFLYVLDKENGKVFALEKDGKFKAQYSFETIKEVVSLIASESEGKIILLTGEKLLSIEMKHL
ncbi:MAG: hypothetical protein UU32_C0049G0009 [Candidatus Woesebacteria bacterium GW2011_GWB1_41_10]|uniref:Uncharacterized protein n=1 Tax=Candidatus Woesebacteria bacterium GW2011_GWB1_41_10 TaxID=1618577 RepID=A0A0G0UA53_9BACT|nr:MAG: hypothetical protein UU32_C0049G0009 [Candidatus Woesebacteria bacterium GW2011_GWB1_41_10]